MKRDFDSQNRAVVLKGLDKHFKFGGLAKSRLTRQQ